MGFIFTGDTAVYTGDDYKVFLTYEDEVLQMATEYWGRDVERIFVQGMTIIMGREAANDHVFYIDRALSIPNSVHKSDYMQAFTQDGALFVHLYLK